MTSDICPENKDVMPVVFSFWIAPMIISFSEMDMVAVCLFCPWSFTKNVLGSTTVPWEMPSTYRVISEPLITPAIWCQVSWFREISDVTSVQCIPS